MPTPAPKPEPDSTVDAIAAAMQDGGDPGDENDAGTGTTETPEVSGESETQDDAEQVEEASATAPDHLGSALDRLERIEGGKPKTTPNASASTGDDIVALAEKYADDAFAGDDEGQKVIKGLAHAVKDLQNKLNAAIEQPKVMAEARRDTLAVVDEIGGMPGFPVKLDAGKPRGGLSDTDFETVRKVIAKADEYRVKAEKAGEKFSPQELASLAVAKVAPHWLKGKAQTGVQKRQALIRVSGQPTQSRNPSGRFTNPTPHGKEKRAALALIEQAMQDQED